MSSPKHETVRGMSPRESQSSRRSPVGLGIDKRINNMADDSEAETEILSANNTPAKRRKSVPTEAREKFAELNLSKTQDDDTKTNDNSMVDTEPDGGTLTISPRRDRRPTNEMLGDTTATVKEEHNPQQQTSSTGSIKRTRLGRAVSMKSEDDEIGRAESENPLSPRMTRAQSSNANSSTANLSSPPSTSTDSKRAATQEPRSRSRSHSPTRRSHKRSSSFHSAIASANTTRERKQRNRRTLREESFAASPREEMSPSRNDGSPAGRLTPGQHGHGHQPRKDNTGRTAFSKACERGSVADVKSHLEKVALERASIVDGDPLQIRSDIDEPDYAGNCPLQFAALKGHSDVVKVLIEHGCKYRDVENAEGDTPLLDACSNGHKEIVKILLEAGVNPAPKNKKGRRAEDELDDLQDDELKAEIQALLDDARSKWKDERREHEIAEYERRREAKSVAPLITRGSRRNQHIRNDLLYVQASLPRLRRYAEDGDEEGARYLIKSGIVADNSCASAAAARGHMGVLETLFTFGGAKSDPDPDEVSEQTPMVAAISGGEIEVIRFVLGYEGFKAGRKIDGKTYEELAVEIKGPRWQEVAQIFKKAVSGAETDDALHNTTSKSRQTTPDPPTKRRRLRTGREMAAAAARAEAPSSSQMDDATDNDDKSFVSTAVSSPQPMQNGTSVAPTPEPSIPAIAPQLSMPPSPVSPPEPPPRPETPPQEQRDRYLATLPRAIGKALEPQGWIRVHVDKTKPLGPGYAEIAHLKGLEDWMPIPMVRRQQLQPDCDAADKHEGWILGYYASIFLRHARLDEVATKLLCGTVPVTPAWREHAWTHLGIEEHIAKDHDWLKASPALWPTCGVPVTVQTIAGGHQVKGIHWLDISKESRQQWNALPSDQCVWIRATDFLKATKMAPHLKNLIIRMQSAHLPNSPPLLYQNGKQVAAPKPTPEELACPYPNLKYWVPPPWWRTSYAKFAEKWVVKNGTVVWESPNV